NFRDLLKVYPQAAVSSQNLRSSPREGVVQAGATGCRHSACCTAAELWERALRAIGGTSRARRAPTGTMFRGGVGQAVAVSTCPSGQAGIEESPGSTGHGAR